MPVQSHRHGRRARVKSLPCLCKATGMARAREGSRFHACAKPQAWHPRESEVASMPVQSHRHGTRVRFFTGVPTVFARFFIDRPVFATVISVVITLAGFVAVFTLPVAQ